MRTLVSTLLLAGVVAAAEPNTLTPEEKASGWRLLFDGRTFANFEDPSAKTPPSDSWSVRDGALVAVKHPRSLEDLTTTESFGDFELEFEWSLEPRGNSGIKHHIANRFFLIHERPGFMHGRRAERAELQPGQRGQLYAWAYEFQLLDDERHPDTRNGPTHRLGALYGMISPSQEIPFTADEWHTGRLVVKEGALEHWIDGVRVLAARFDDPRIHQSLRQKDGSASPIAFQNHSDSEVRFRSIKIRTR
jgi:hypothetical protein